jgi:hypothetical protein
MLIVRNQYVRLANEYEWYIGNYNMSGKHEFYNFRYTMTYEFANCIINRLKNIIVGFILQRPTVSYGHLTIIL